MLHRREDSVHAVLSGTLERPVLTGREGDVARLKGDISLLVSTARAGSALPASHIEVHTVSDSSGAQQQAQLLTGRAARVLLVQLTMLLAGMVLPNMVVETNNKIIENHAHAG